MEGYVVVIHHSLQVLAVAELVYSVYSDLHAGFLVKVRGN